MRHEIFEPADVHKHFGTTLWSVEIDSCQNEPTASREKLRETLDRTGPFEPKSATLYLNVLLYPLAGACPPRAGRSASSLGLDGVVLGREYPLPAMLMIGTFEENLLVSAVERVLRQSSKSELKANSGKSIRNFLNIAITGL